VIGQIVFAAAAANFTVSYCPGATGFTSPIWNDGGGDSYAAVGIAPVLLAITHTGHQIVVSWPPALTGWQIQTNHDLRTTNWGNYSGPVVNNSLTNRGSGGPLLFLLAK
jgi:hypothetical protein